MITTFTIDALIDAGLSKELLKTIKAAFDLDIENARNDVRELLREQFVTTDAGSATPAAVRMRKMRENRRLLKEHEGSKVDGTDANNVTEQGVTSYNTLKESKGLEGVVKEESKPVVIAREPRKIAYSEKFEQKFWAAYPRDSGMSKSEAFKVWRKMPDAEQDKAIAAIPGFKEWVAKQGTTYRVVHACRYLSQHRYDGFGENNGRNTTDIAGKSREEVLDFLRS